jgi:glutaredoxin
MKNYEKVQGDNKGKVVLYSLSTCIWCKKTKQLLNDLKIEYSYINIDEVESDDKEKFREELRNWNPKCSFPTLVINDSSCIVGYEEDKIRKELA